MRAPRPLHPARLWWAGCVRSGAGLLLGACLVAGCQSPELLDSEGGPLVIPLAQPEFQDGGGLRDLYYRDVIRQLHEASQEEDLDHMVALLATHDIPAAPEWSQQMLRDFRARTGGMQLELWSREAGRMRIWDGSADAAPGPLVDTAAPLLVLGRPKTVEVQLGGLGRPLPEALRGTVLPGAEGESGEGTGGSHLAVTISVADMDVAGNRKLQRSTRVIRLAQDTPLQEGLRQQMELELDAGEVLIRELDLKVDLLPGQAIREGEAMPHGRVLVASGRHVAALAGAEKIRRYPVRALARALSLGTPDAMAAIVLACRWMPEGERPAVTERLIQLVRNGDVMLARTAMVGLREMHALDLPVTDRDPWLEWWAGRAR